MRYYRESRVAGAGDQLNSKLNRQFLKFSHVIRSCWSDWLFGLISAPPTSCSDTHVHMHVDGSISEIWSGSGISVCWAERGASLLSSRYEPKLLLTTVRLMLQLNMIYKPLGLFFWNKRMYWLFLSWCFTGPTLMFERFYSDKPPRKFFACAVHRDRKGCPFFVWADEKISEEKRERWEKGSQYDTPSYVHWMMALYCINYFNIMPDALILCVCLQYIFYL